LLCLVILIAYQMYFAPTPPPAGPPAETADPSGASQPGPADPTEKALIPAEKTAAEAPAVEATDEGAPEAVIKGERRKKVVVRTEAFTLEFSNVGAKLTSCRLRDYKKRVEGDERLDLISKQTASGIMPFELFSDRNKDVAKLNHVIYETEAERLDLTGPGAPDTAEISFRYADGRYFDIEKRFTFYKQDFLVDIDVTVHQAEETQGLYLVWGPGLAPDKDETQKGGFFSGGAGGINRGVYLLSEKPERLEPKKVDYIENISGYLAWLGCENNYFSALFLPNRDADDSRPVEAMFLKTKSVSLASAQKEPEVHRLTAGMALNDKSNAFSFYMGPKDYDILKAYGRGMETIVDFGFFGALAKALLFSLKWIYQYLPNYGVAIIILTIIINVLFYPLKHKQIKSMQKMQALQPKINAIKEKYKKLKDAQSRQKMNQETMSLYKKEGVNPLGGCLPLLIQLPFFYGFFRLLSAAIEMRHAPFMLWIQDLSARDPLYITPLLMGASMFLVQKMTPTPTMGGSSQQAKMLKYMPLFFILFFLNFAAGLVLYWLFNNIISIVQQYFINRSLTAAPGPGKGTAAPKGRRSKT
jgi:YidC/Oxa1 family membrane protein insertase